MAIQLGASLPVGDIGTGGPVVRDYAQTLEGWGIDYIQAPDHVLGLDPRKVGIKATTNEKMGFVGREEGIAAMAVASVDLPE